MDRSRRCRNTLVLLNDWPTPISLRAVGEVHGWSCAQLDEVLNSLRPAGLIDPESTVSGFIELTHLGMKVAENSSVCEAVRIKRELRCNILRALYDHPHGRKVCVDLRTILPPTDLRELAMACIYLAGEGLIHYLTMDYCAVLTKAGVERLEKGETAY